MSDLVEFAKQVTARLAAANTEPSWKTDEADAYMAAVASRRNLFETVSNRLIEHVIRPRLELFASYFTNSSMTKDEPSHQCACWFGYCERFPTSSKVTFAIDHDIGFLRLAVRYEASMTPLFIKLHEADKLEFELQSPNDDSVANWVEVRLLNFANSYLMIDRGRADFLDEPATDPVCGMRISRSMAAASDSFRGHPYFFCSHECQRCFANKPNEYVDVKESS